MPSRDISVVEVAEVPSGIECEKGLDVVVRQV